MATVAAACGAWLLAGTGCDGVGPAGTGRVAVDGEPGVPPPVAPPAKEGPAADVEGPAAVDQGWRPPDPGALDAAWKALPVSPCPPGMVLVVG
ncbi:MAG: hypothetical protein D6798_21210, partial [Deltaproteobacteria bacterium]